MTDGLLRSTIQAWTDWRLWYVLLAGASVAVTSWIIATKTGSFEGYWLLGYLGGFGTAVVVDWFSEQFQ